MDLGVVTNILADILKFYSYKNLDEVEEFKNIITSTEFLTKDIFDRICSKLKEDYFEDYQTLHKINEFVYLADLKRLYEIYLRILENYFDKN